MDWYSVVILLCLPLVRVLLHSIKWTVELILFVIDTIKRDF